jgi:PadR family transcriptional regulator, regulatory protein PadR
LSEFVIPLAAGFRRGEARMSRRAAPAEMSDNSPYQSTIGQPMDPKRTARPTVPAKRRALPASQDAAISPTYDKVIGESMAKHSVGSFEMLVLAALIGRPRGSYGIEIADRIEQQAKRDISLGALYTALERLERRGLLTSKWGLPTAERGGRRKRYFSVTGTGERIFREAQVAVVQLAGPAASGVGQ